MDLELVSLFDSHLLQYMNSTYFFLSMYLAVEFWVMEYPYVHV